MNMTTRILLDIYFCIFIYKDTFTKLYRHIGAKIGESFYIQLYRMCARRQYDRVYNNNTHAEMLKSQILQNKIREKNLKQAKGDMKGSFGGTSCAIGPIFEI